MRRRKRRRRRNKTIWFVSRFATAIVLLASIGIFIHGCFLFGSFWFVGSESGFSQANVIQSFKLNKKVASKDDKKEKTKKKKNNKAKQIEDYPSYCELEKVEKPIERSGIGK